MIAGAASATASALSPALSLAAPDIGKTSLDTDRHKQWRQLLGESFVVEEAGTPLARLKLNELRKGQKAPRLDQFHLYFSNTGTVMLEERSYQLYHPESGSQQMFLQPVIQSSGDPYYRATFSLLVDDA